MNALTRREDAATAVHTPVSIIPGGSGNGLASSVGFFSPYDACLGIIGGFSRPLDLLEVEQEGVHTATSFLLVGWGVVSDIDFQVSGKWKECVV